MPHPRAVIVPLPEFPAMAMAVLGSLELVWLGHLNCRGCNSSLNPAALPKKKESKRRINKKSVVLNLLQMAQTTAMTTSAVSLVQLLKGVAVHCGLCSHFLRCVPNASEVPLRASLLKGMETFPGFAQGDFLFIPQYRPSFVGMAIFSLSHTNIWTFICWDDWLILFQMS